MVVTAKSFSTQEAAPLARTILATFSDDATGAPGSFSCSASGYTATVDWGDGSAPSSAQVVPRFGGDFALCEYSVTSDHKYAHFGVFTTTVSIAGGPQAHSGTDTGQITVADVGIAGQGQPANAAAGTPFVGQVAEFKDQNQLSQPGDFSSTIDWGDGSLPTTGVISGQNGQFEVSGTHTYTAPGSYAVRTTFSHPTAAPAVALSTMTVGAAAPQNQQPNGQQPQFTGVFSVRGTAARNGVTLKALRKTGLAIRIAASKARTETIEVLSGTKKVGSTKVKVKGGVNNVRWRPSASLVKKLKAAKQYGLRIKVSGEPTLQLTFRTR
jgi:hypothetical protein